MSTINQAADRRLPWQGEAHAIAVTSTSTAYTLAGAYNSYIPVALEGRSRRDDAGRIYTWLADGGDVYVVVGPITKGSVTGAGTTPPTLTLAGNPACVGAMRLDCDTTDGTFAGSTFSLSVAGTAVETGLAPNSDGVIDLRYSGLTGTLSAATLNVDNYWTWTNSGPTVDNTAADSITPSGVGGTNTNGTVAVKLPSGVPTDAALPTVPESAQAAVYGGGIAVAVKTATGTATLRFWASSGD